LKIIFSGKAWEDYLYWQKTDKQLLKRTNELIEAIRRDPFEGIGKPEPLKHGLSGYIGRVGSMTNIALSTRLRMNLC
jgi:toxin YoeB